MLTDLTLTDHAWLPPLRIERLARLNLLVGKNGVGKTAVLEAIHGRAELPSIRVDMRCNLPLLCEYEARRGGAVLSTAAASTILPTSRVSPSPEVLPVKARDYRMIRLEQK